MKPNPISQPVIADESNQIFEFLCGTTSLGGARKFLSFHIVLHNISRRGRASTAQKPFSIVAHITLAQKR